MFEGLSLRKAIEAHPPLLNGGTLDGSMPCRLLHAVTRCAPASAVSRPEPMRVNSSRIPSPTQLSEMHDALLAYAEHVPRPTLSEPPNMCVRPRMTFQPTEIQFDGTFLPTSRRVRVDSGPYAGKSFLPRIKAIGPPAGCMLFVGKEEPQKGQSTRWRAKANRKMQKLLAQDGPCCVCCMEDLRDGFLLCPDCETAPTVVHECLGEPLEFNEYHLPRNAKRFRVSKNRKDNGFQDAANYKKNPSLLSDNRYVSPSEPYTDGGRPLLEHELSWILAVKYPGFTRPGSLEYKKAQRAAAQLAGHFIFKRTFAEITRTVPMTTEESVRKLCLRAREDYWAKYVRSGRMPVEAVAAMTTGMLRRLYPPSLTDGHFCHSATCCAA